MKDANKGYIGFSMSVRAAEARSENKLPKSDFKKAYGISEKAFKEVEPFLEKEWHHTSKLFNKTNFYRITNDVIHYLIGLNPAKFGQLENELKEDEFKVFELNQKQRNFFDSNFDSKLAKKSYSHNLVNGHVANLNRDDKNLFNEFLNRF